MNEAQMKRASSSRLHRRHSVLMRAMRKMEAEAGSFKGGGLKRYNLLAAELKAIHEVLFARGPGKPKPKPAKGLPVVWSLAVEVYGFGLVVTLHASEREARRELRWSYNQSLKDETPGAAADPEKACRVEDYDIGCHGLPAGLGLGLGARA